jgi:membrane protein
MRRLQSTRRWFGLSPRKVRAFRLPWLANFFADRGTHLAAMIAYYALLSFVPLLFLLLLPLQLAGEQTESSFLIRRLSEAFPGQSVSDIVRVVNDLRGPASTIGLIGLALLIWSALGLLSAIGSALNIIYEVPNRPFLQQKMHTLVLVLAAIVGLFGVLTVTTAVSAVASTYADSVFGLLSVEEALGLVFSMSVTTALLFVVYRYVPNTPMTTREVLPGTFAAAAAFQAGFLALPLYLDAIDTVPSLKALGGFVILLVWFFLMSNVMLLGAEINWWYGRGREQADDDAMGLA